MIRVWNEAVLDRRKAGLLQTRSRYQPENYLSRDPERVFFGLDMGEIPFFKKRVALRWAMRIELTIPKSHVLPMTPFVKVLLCWSSCKRWSKSYPKKPNNAELYVGTTYTGQEKNRGKNRRWSNPRVFAREEKLVKYVCFPFFLRLTPQ